MSANTKIEWCDHTFNPWIGCTKVSPGCANCYAERDFSLRRKVVGWGKGEPRKRTAPANWNLPKKWNDTAICDECGNTQSICATAGNLGLCKQCHRDTMRNPRVFCGSLCDWLDDEAPIEWLCDLLALIQATPNLDWLLLTKRPGSFGRRIELASCQVDRNEENAERYLLNPAAYMASWLVGNAPKNIWIGTSVEDQQRADERIPELVKIPAKIRFLSCEPLLGEVEIKFTKEGSVTRGATDPLTGYTTGDGCYEPWIDHDHRIHWVIAGGESGPNARPMHPKWVRGLRDQCVTDGVPFLFKQWGEWLPGEQTASSGTGYSRCDNGKFYCHSGNPKRENFGTDPDRHSGKLITLKIGKKAAGRLLDGVEHNDFPKS